MSAVKKRIPPIAGRVPWIFSPAAYSTMFTVAAMNVTTAPMVTARGRSPGPRGFRFARASALRNSDREGGLGAGAAAAGRGARCFLLRLPNYLLHVAAQLGGGGAGIIGVADRAD